MHLDELKMVYLQHNFTELIIGYEEKEKRKKPLVTITYLGIKGKLLYYGHIILISLLRMLDQ